MQSENQQDGLKFFGLSLENFKNISHKIIDIGGSSFKVVGPNGSGKSSIIQALCSPLDVKLIPSKPIKKGEERAKLEVTLKGSVNGNPVKYTLDLFFSPQNERGRLVVTNEAGEIVKSPASFVKGLIGNVSFDITKWMHESNEKKLKMLKQLTGCEIEIDKINMAITKHKADKKIKKERAEELEAVLKNHNYTQEQIELYSDEKPITPIQEELATISQSLEKYNSIEEQIAKFKKSIETEEFNIGDQKLAIEADGLACEKEIKRLNDLITQAKNDLAVKTLERQAKIDASFLEINKLKGNIVKGDKWLSERTKPSALEITERLNTAIAHNEHFNIVSVLAEKQKEMIKFKSEATAIDGEIEKLENNRGSLIAKSQLPIKGLSFTDNEIFIDGLPLEEGQQNTASLFDIGVDVAIALNPGLKVIFLHDASLFDEKNLESLIRKIEARGFQCVAEVVAEGELDIKFTESEVR